MMWRVYLHIALAFSVAVVDGQSCDGYYVEVKQFDNRRASGVTLECSFNSTDQDRIEWRTKATDTDSYRTAYNAYPNFPDFDEPTTEFVDKLDGLQGPSSHELTIINATTDDNLTFWRCIVSTPGCINTNFDELELVLIDVDFQKSDIIQNGQEVTCYALSDPQSTVSLAGSTSGQTCVRVDGDPLQPWNCSVMRTVKKHRWENVKCSVTYENDDKSPHPIRVLVGMHWGWITFIVIAVVAVCVGGAVGGFIYYKKIKSASTE